MEIATSCEIETKFKCKIDLNIQDIGKNYKIKDDKFDLNKCYNFALNFSNGTQFTAFVYLNHVENKCKNFHLITDDKVFEAEDCKVSYEITFNGNDKIKDSVKAKKWKFSNETIDRYGFKRCINGPLNEKIETCKGWIELEFKPCSAIIEKQELKTLVYQATFGSTTQNPDFTILCQGKSFKFNKTKLCFLSDVFHKMIETSFTQESKSGSVEIQDFSPDVIEAFDRVMFGNNESLDEKDLTVNLLMFANKYCILPLVKIVANHLGNNLTKENIYPVIKAAYLMDNDELLENASKFIANNPKQLQNSEEWQELKKSHPQCFVKMMELIMFQK